MPHLSSVQNPTTRVYQAPVMMTYACACITGVRLGCVVFFALVGLHVTPSGAINTESTRATLQGLLGIHVAIEELTPEVESAGLTTRQLQTDVELRLRLAGIRVLTREERDSVVGKPWLYVHVNVLLNQLLGLTVYHISVELYQSVSLDTDAVASGGAATWGIATTGTHALSDLSRVHHKVRDLVDEFINAYLSANPRPTGGPVLSQRPDRRGVRARTR